MEKRVVVILIIVALVLAVLSIAYSIISNNGDEVQNVNGHVIVKSSGSGRVGVVIDSSNIENKNG